MTAAPATAASSRQPAWFPALAGALFGTVLLKFGNPVILADRVEMPESFVEILLGAWPPAWGYLLLFVMGIAGLFCARRPSSPPVWVWIALLFWIAWSMMSAGRSVAPRLSWPTVWHFGGCAACFACGALVLSRWRDGGWFWAGVLAAFCLTLAFGAEQRFGGLEETRRFFEQLPPEVKAKFDTPEFRYKMASNRIYSTFFYPNVFAGAILLLLPPLSYVMWRTAAPRATPVAAGTLVTLFIIFALACLFWTGSKSGWLITIIIGLTALLRAPVTKKLKVALIVCVALGGLGAFALKYSGYFGRGASSLQARFDYWRVAVQAIGERPLLGHGPGAFQVPYKRLKPPAAEMTRLTHNDYLEQAADSGLPAAFAYAALVLGSIIVLARRCWSDPLRAAVWLGVAAWAMQSFVEFGLYVPALAWTAFALLGWLWGTEEKRIA